MYKPLSLYDDLIDRIITLAFDEDLFYGDQATNAIIPQAQQATAVMTAKHDGVISGLEIARRVISMLGDNEFKPCVADGDEVSRGDQIVAITASYNHLLSSERVMLNFMQRMSGIATTTREYVDLVKDTNVILLDTRKTTPNMRLFEKYAVTVGGAQNHRFGLYDMMMLKDNHIDFAGGIEKAIDAANKYLKDRHLQLDIEIETRSLDDVRRVLGHGGVQRIMFDNFTPDQIREGVALVDHRVETEASGGIVKETLHDYAITGVDFISVGAFTHQIRSLDMSLKAL